jgi:hypothetical protein
MKRVNIVAAALVFAITFTFNACSSDDDGGNPACKFNIPAGGTTVTMCSEKPKGKKEECQEAGGTFSNGCPSSATLECNYGEEKHFFYGDMKGGNCDDVLKGFTVAVCNVDFGVNGKMCMQSSLISKELCDESAESGGGEVIGYSFDKSGSCPSGSGKKCELKENGMRMDAFLYGDIANLSCEDIFED